MAGAAHTYPEVGITRHGGAHLAELAPAHYDIDHTHAQLGQGEADFARARAALAAWLMFDLRWVTLCYPDQPPAPGLVVGVLAKTAGLWSLNISRVLYVVDEEVGGGRRYGFAYGTLPHHVECGEERFEVEQRADGSVWYQVTAMSHPRHLLVRLGYRFARHTQRQFAAGSVRRMRQAVAESRAREANPPAAAGS